MEDKLRQLELKVTELENKLKEMGAGAAAAIDPEDLKTFQKVNNQLGVQAICTVCKTNPCILVCRPPHTCIWTCSWLCPCGPGGCYACGPCTQSSNLGGGFGGFME